MPADKSLPDPETTAGRLLALVAISGEFPTGLLPRLPGGRWYKETVAKTLKQKRLLRTHSRDGVRAYRLTAHAKSLLTADNPERFSFALTGSAETNHSKSEITRRLRLHRIAETIVTMQNAGVSVFRDEKPEMFSPVWGKGGQIQFDIPAFYTSREMKELGTVFVKISGARSVGVLLTENEIFVTYNLVDSLMKWSYKAEMRMKALMKTVLCRERLPDVYAPDAVQGLLLGNDMRLASEILAGEGGRQYFLLDGSYDHFHFLTNDHKGERLLSLLYSPALRERLDSILLTDLYESDDGMTVENDALEADGTPALLAYTCDLPRIKRFDTALRLQNRTGTVICFDYQRDALKCCCGEGVRFRTIDFQKWERSFFEP